jgi:hypothetical protein
MAFLDRYNTVLLATTGNAENCTSIQAHEQDYGHVYISPNSATINALNADGTYELWHQRLNHSSPEVMYEMQKRAIGIPKLK